MGAGAGCVIDNDVDYAGAGDGLNDVDCAGAGAGCVIDNDVDRAGIDAGCVIDGLCDALSDVCIDIFFAFPKLQY